MAPPSASANMDCKHSSRRGSSRQIEAARREITNYLKRGGKIWIRIFPGQAGDEEAGRDANGLGKGNPEYWVAVVKPGRIMFEISGVDRERAEEALRRAAMKCRWTAALW